MKINDITQFPFGTVLSLSGNVPDNSVGKFLTADGKHLHKIKGTPSNIWTEVLIESTYDMQIGQEVKIMKIV